MKKTLPNLRRSRGEPGIKVGAGIGQPAMLEQVQPGVILMSCTSMCERSTQVRTH